MNTAKPPRRAADGRPLVCHIVFRFDYGGLENGLVNLINGLPAAEFRHAIVALTEASEFRRRIARDDVEVHELHKRPGKDPRAYIRLHSLLRKLGPNIVHTRNIGTMDCAVVAALAGIPCRVHGEHGWDVHDPDGITPKYLRMRRMFGHFVRQFVTVSADLERWLVEKVGIEPGKVRRICNGVDTDRFSPRTGAGHGALESRFPPGSVVFCSVTRFSEIKDPLNLVRAFVAARGRLLKCGIDARLMMVGDGPMRGAALELLTSSGCSGAAWLPGSRDDVAHLLASVDVFVLGSRREGISNTVLEAMASGLPVIASETGGNIELVQSGVTGALVPPGDSAALAQVVFDYACDAELRARQGAAARACAVHRFSLGRMIAEYRRLYLEECSRTGVVN